MFSFRLPSRLQRNVEISSRHARSQSAFRNERRREEVLARTRLVKEIDKLPRDGIIDDRNCRMHRDSLSSPFDVDSNLHVSRTTVERF